MSADESQALQRALVRALVALDRAEESVETQRKAIDALTERLARLDEENARLRAQLEPQGMLQ